MVSKSTVMTFGPTLLASALGMGAAAQEQVEAIYLEQAVERLATLVDR